MASSLAAFDPVFDASAHNIVSLDKVLANDPASLRDLLQEFKLRGWCVVRLPKENSKTKGNYYHAQVGYEYLSAMPERIDSLMSFFQGKNKKACYGYSSVPHKKSIHIVTPAWDNKERIANNIKGLVSKWIELFDILSLDFLEAIAQPIFGLDVATLSHRADLPVAFGMNNGMFDIAYYKNEKTATISPEIGYSTEDVNCVPHYDPGLLSISFLSTNDGLQLQDPVADTWCAGPVNTRKGEEDLGVIWLGAAAVTASKGGLRAGVHRVVYPSNTIPRITSWYEICTVEQINNDEIMIPNSGTIQIPNLPGSKPLELNGKKRQKNVIERHYGVPMSKVMNRTDKFASYFSDDKNEIQWF